MEKKKNLTLTIEAGQVICCPLPEHVSWNNHPRVYIKLEDGKGICPYCSTKFTVRNS